MNNELNELKPCPFCSGKAEEDTSIGGVVCENYCTNPNTFDGGGGVWTTDWNTRPIEDALNARIIELENLVEVQRDDNCHLADMCRERDDRIAKLEIALAEALPYEISEKIRKGEGTYIPMPESSEEREE